MEKKTIFWDVDTQFDFMSPEGALYVPGAEGIIDTVSAVRRSALENGYSILADVDWHHWENPEISTQPDMQTTFPPHCMAGTPGAERVGDLGDVPIDTVAIDDVEMAELQKLVQKPQFHIVIRKQSLNVFDNPNTHKLVDLVRPEHVIAFGVALDCCVYYVLSELAKHPGVKLSLLADATRGLQIRPEEQVYDELRQLGVEVMTCADLRLTMADVPLTAGTATHKSQIINRKS